MDPLGTLPRSPRCGSNPTDKVPHRALLWGLLWASRGDSLWVCQSFALKKYHRAPPYCTARWGLAVFLPWISIWCLVGLKEDRQKHLPCSNRALNPLFGVSVTIFASVEPVALHVCGPGSCSFSQARCAALHSTRFHSPETTLSEILEACSWRDAEIYYPTGIHAQTGCQP